MTPRQQGDALGPYHILELYEKSLAAHRETGNRHGQATSFLDEAVAALPARAIAATAARSHLSLGRTLLAQEKTGEAAEVIARAAAFAANRHRLHAPGSGDRLGPSPRPRRQAWDGDRVARPDRGRGEEARPAAAGAGGTAGSTGFRFEASTLAEARMSFSSRPMLVPSPFRRAWRHVF